MAVFEIINPSDPYTVETDEFAAACLATIALGYGHYGLKEIGGEGREMPIFLFGGHDAWFRKQFGKTLPQLAEVAPRAKIAQCLESVTLCDADEPSSLNDIGRRARELAAAMRKAEAQP